MIKCIDMGAFTNSRVVPLGKDGKPVKIQEYTSDPNESSRPLSQLEALFKKLEKKQTKK
jgi:hypothetical protein